MKKINTLFLICGLSVGGAETMLVNLANRFNLEKFNVTVASLDAHNPLAEKIRPGAIKVVAFPRKWRYDLSPAYDLGRLILRENIDKVMVFGTFELVFLRAAFWNLPNPPQVYVSIHSTVWQSPKQRIQHFLYARLLTGSEKIVSVCNAQADYWSKTYLIPRSRFTTVYNGVDVNFFAPQGLTDIRSTVRSQWGIPPDAFVFL